MRKFKHKKLNGVTAIKLDNKSGQYKTNGIDDDFAEFVPAFFIENSNDWEEVKEAPQMPFKEHTSKVRQVSGDYVKEEPNYLITAFRDLRTGYTKDIWKITSDGFYCKNGHAPVSLNHMINTGECVNNGKFEIYSVKNKYGIEYILNDFVNYNFNKVEGSPFKIHNFFINRDGILLSRSSNESSATCEDINTIYKCKSPIYTTTDGVEVFEGDRVILHILGKENTIGELKESVVLGAFSKQDKEVAERYLTFTSAENRDKYIKENQRKPLFISEDGKEMFEGDIVYKAISESKTIVPYHASKGECTTKVGARFSSHEAASEYLKRLNPIFVSADGKEFYSGDTDYSLFSVLPKANWQENRYRLNDCVKFPKKEWLHFHTKEARQEYIDNNKPKFSFVDIENAYCKAMNSEFDGLGEIIEELKKLGK